MTKDNAPPHRYGPGYDLPSDITGKRFENVSMVDIAKGITMGNAAKNATIRTERATAKDDSVARQLLSNARGPRYQEIKPDDIIKLKGGEKFVVLPKEDKRPLIDRVHEATFTNPVGMQWFDDLYGLRMLLRKAKCFTLDDATSAMTADFSIAIGHDLESTRRISIPPFPVTWIDLNNRVRLNRIK